MTTRRRWTDSTIEAELTAIVGGLGRMPTRRELTDRGLGGLWTAMQRHGGLAAWRGRVTPGPAPAVPSRDAIARRAYFIALERGGGDPFLNWLAAEAELAAT